ncbi:MAG: hypothetical protein AAB306_04295 [Pseudomonadota bacterium]
MDQAEKKRKLILGAALIATLIAVVFVEEEDDELGDPVGTIQPTKSTAPDRTGASQSSPAYLDVNKLGQRKFSAEAGDLFASTSWIPKPPEMTMQQQQTDLAQQAAKTPSAPRVPTPPPLQFKYIGKAITEKETWVFLSRSGENLVAKLGGLVDDKYRIDTINDEAIIFTYLPLNAKQTFTINNKITGNIR